MSVNISGAGIKLGDSIQVHVRAKISALSEKYKVKFSEFDVSFQKEGKDFIHANLNCHVLEHHSWHMKMSANDSDPYHAFDVALVKVEKMLRKHADKLKSKSAHYAVSTCDEGREFKKFLLQSLDKYENTLENDIVASEDNPAPKIVSEKSVSMQKLSLNKALLKMEMENLSVLPFVNSDTLKVNFVYRDASGEVTWMTCS